MASVMINSRQTKIEEYFKPPPKSAESIRSNHLVQNVRKGSNTKNNYNRNIRKPNGNLSPKGTDANNKNHKSKNGHGHHGAHWFKNAKRYRKKNKQNNSYTHLIAFDFDQTLSSVQVYNGSNRTGVDLFGGKYRVELIDKFLKYLKSESIKNGYNFRIIIITYNFRNVVVQRLKELNLVHYFQKIYDRHDVNHHGGFKKGKGNLLRVLSTKWNVNFTENTLIIDDCDDVIWNCHCQTVHVSNYRGMNKSEMQQVCNKFKLKVPNFVLSVI